MSATRPSHKLALGYAQWGKDEVTPEEMIATVGLAINNGVETVDVAPHYAGGGREKVLALALNALQLANRSKVKIATKVGRVIDTDKKTDQLNGFTSHSGFAQHSDYSGKGIVESFEQSKKRLNLATIDTLYLHDMDATTYPADFKKHEKDFFVNGGYQALNSLKETGQIKVIGIGSNDVNSCIQLIKDGRLKIDRIMIAGCFNLIDHSALNELFPLCKQKKIELYVAAPYAGGFLSAPDNIYFKYKLASTEERAKKAKILAICEKYNIPLAHAAMQFAHMHPQVACVVVGARTRQEFSASLVYANNRLPLSFWRALHTEKLITDECFSYLAVASTRDHKANIKTEMKLAVKPFAADAEVVDAHQHFWKFGLTRRKFYTWMKSAPVGVSQDFLPEDLSPTLQKHGIKKTILVQASANQLETDYMLQLAKTNPFIVGVVGWVNMNDPVNACKKITNFAAHAKFVGIRPMIQDIADPKWMLNPDFKPIYEKLIKEKLVFEALVRPEHLENLVLLLQSYPTLKVVIDHAAKPQIAKKDFDIEKWKKEMTGLAANRNVSCKLSGLLAEASPNCTYADIKPYLDFLYKTFGPKRLIWGSDWPMVNLAGGYDKWVDITQTFLTEKAVNLEDRRAILGGNAAQMYGWEARQQHDAKTQPLHSLNRSIG